MVNKKRLILERYTKIKNDKEVKYISLRNFKTNKIIKTFLYDSKRTKPIIHLSKNKTANEKVIFDYYKSRHKKETGNDYKGLSPEKFKKDFIKFKEKNEIDKFKYSSKQFKNRNRLIFSNKKIKEDFDFMYIQVRLKIYLDGIYVYDVGRSKYKYDKEIKNNEVPIYLKQAILNCIGRYGSEVNFKLLSWAFGYHQINHIHYNKYDEIEEE